MDVRILEIRKQKRPRLRVPFHCRIHSRPTFLERVRIAIDMYDRVILVHDAAAYGLFAYANPTASFHLPHVSYGEPFSIVGDTLGETARVVSVPASCGGLCAFESLHTICPSCNLDCGSPRALYSHLRSSHMMLMPYRCNRCAMQMTRNATVGHRCREPYRQIRCSICFFVAFSESVMEAHVVEHGPYTPFEVANYPAKVEIARETHERRYRSLF